MGGRIAIFGGSFNPVHSGHVRVVENAIRELELDKVIVIPAFCSPFKTGGEAFLAPADRLELVRLAFAGIGKAEIDTRELEAGGISYAIDTVRAVAEEEHPDKLFFLIGQDSVAGLGRWKDAEKLMQLCEFVPFPRTAESSTEIRRRVRAGEKADMLMPPQVAAKLKTMEVLHG